MDSNENAASKKRSKKKQVLRRRSDNLTHKQAEGAVPEDLAVAGEEDGGVGIQHWRSDDGAENDNRNSDQ